VQRLLINIKTAMQALAILRSKYNPLADALLLFIGQ